MAQVVGFEGRGNPMDNGEKLLRMAEIGCSATRTYTKTCGLGGATEHAGVENAIRAKLQGWKMQE